MGRGRYFQQQWGLLRPIFKTDTLLGAIFCIYASLMVSGAINRTPAPWLIMGLLGGSNIGACWLWDPWANKKTIEH